MPEIRRAPGTERREIWSPHIPRIVGDASQRRIRAVANTDKIDRYLTRVLPSGMRIERGPLPLLFNHRSDRPAGRIEQIERTDTAIVFDAQITDENVWRMVRDGSVTGTSIGFQPIDWQEDDVHDGVLVCRSWNLVEISICAVPANTDAQIEEIRSFTHTPEDRMPPFPPPLRTDREPAPGGPRLVDSRAAAPAVHTARATPFNVGRVWQCMVEGRTIDGLEGEVTRELEKRSDVMTRGVRLPAALFKPPVSRAVSTDPASIGALSPTVYMGQLLDDMSAARRWGSLLPRLGFEQVPTTRESAMIPKRDTRIVASWGPKDADAAESDWTATDDTVTPRYIKATVTIERSALKYSDPSALMLTLSDLGEAIDSGADTGLLYGTGANDQPVGLLTQPGTVVDLAGASVTSQVLMDFKNGFLETWKLDQPIASLRWLMSARSWDALRITSKKQSAAEEWMSGLIPFDIGEGVLLGIGAVQSGKVAVSATANAYPIQLIRGNMGVVVWFAGGSIDTIVDATTLSTRGAVRISAFLDCNSAIRDPQIVHQLSNVLAAPPGPAPAPPPLAARGRQPA